jgi:hypothetical protein
MPKKTALTLVLINVLAATAIVANAQSRNLLQNPNANVGAELWRAFGQATIEPSIGNNPCFVVRNGGYFIQDVTLPENAMGQFVAFVGRGSSERINDDGAITDLPYLYGYMLESGTPQGAKVLDYLQGQQMLASTNVRDEWVNMSGVFQVPEKATRIRFFLSQALRRGVPHNGSAARFDNLGLYLFKTEADARAFVNQYH